MAKVVAERDVYSWGSVDYSLACILTNFPMPQTVKVVDGFMVNEDDSIASGQVFTLYGYRPIHRLIGRDSCGNEVAFPMCCPFRLEAEPLRRGPVFPCISDLCNASPVPNCVEVLCERLRCDNGIVLKRGDIIEVDHINIDCQGQFTGVTFKSPDAGPLLVLKLDTIGPFQYRHPYHKDAEDTTLSRAYELFAEPLAIRFHSLGRQLIVDGDSLGTIQLDIIDVTDMVLASMESPTGKQILVFPTNLKITLQMAEKLLTPGSTRRQNTCACCDRNIDSRLMDIMLSLNPHSVQGYCCESLSEMSMLLNSDIFTCGERASTERRPSKEEHAVGNSKHVQTTRQTTTHHATPGSQRRQEKRVTRKALTKGLKSFFFGSNSIICRNDKETYPPLSPNSITIANRTSFVTPRGAELPNRNCSDTDSDDFYDLVGRMDAISLSRKPLIENYGRDGSGDSGISMQIPERSFSPQLKNNIDGGTRGANQIASKTMPIRNNDTKHNNSDKECSDNLIIINNSNDNNNNNKSNNVGNSSSSNNNNNSSCSSSCSNDSKASVLRSRYAHRSDSLRESPYLSPAMSRRYSSATDSSSCYSRCSSYALEAAMSKSSVLQSSLDVESNCSTASNGSSYKTADSFPTAVPTVALPNDLKNLSGDEICQHIELLKLSHHCQTLKDNQVNGDLLLALDALEMVSDLSFTYFEAFKLKEYASGWRPDQCYNPERVSGKGSKNPNDWTCIDVVELMKNIQLTSFAEFCEINQINGTLLEKVLHESAMLSIRSQHEVRISALEEKKLFRFVKNGWRPDNIM